jgi:YD repeat-containing protein
VAGGPLYNLYNPANDQKTNESYDAAGNQTTLGGIIYSLSYDAENRLIQETNGLGNPPVQYAYDGNSRRVQKIIGGTTTVHVYDALNQLAAEYTNSQLDAPPCETCYLAADHLGSTRRSAMKCQRRELP